MSIFQGAVIMVVFGERVTSEVTGRVRDMSDAEHFFPCAAAARAHQCRQCTVPMAHVRDPNSYPSLACCARQALLRILNGPALAPPFEKAVL